MIKETTTAADLRNHFNKSWPGFRRLEQFFIGREILVAEWILNGAALKATDNSIGSWRHLTFFENRNYNLNKIVSEVLSISSLQ
ncbi:hypothetical protein [Terrimonas alba]|uniref:hypothetical protein n=1 Tax=Terrimonas alba TaxID=3349636 RepID=UPI0035F4D6A6